MGTFDFDLSKMIWDAFLNALHILSPYIYNIVFENVITKIVCIIGAAILMLLGFKKKKAYLIAGSIIALFPLLTYFR